MNDAKPQVEVVEETQETLSVLDLDRTPRPEKMRRETSYFDGAHEVHFTERAFKPRHDASLDEIRAFIDALEVRRREIPALPPVDEPKAVSVPVGVPAHYREPLERVIAGALTSVETVHRVGTGTVVDVEWEGADGAQQRGLFLVTEGVATRYDDVASRIDELPAPTPAPAAEPAPGPIAQPEAAPEPAKKGMLGRFGRKKSEPVATPVAPEPAPAAEAETSPAKKGMLGRFGRKEKAPEPAPEAAPGPSPEREPEPGEAAKKRRFGFGKK